MARISELKPAVSHFQKGFKFTVYSSEENTIDFNNNQANEDVKGILTKCLTSVDPNLGTVFEDSQLTEDVVKKLIGLKLVLVVSFDGTDFSAFTSKDTLIMPKKRKEVLKILTKSEGLTLQELGEKLQLNVIQVRQIIDPILASGFADMDESGKVRLARELRIRD